MCGSVGTLSRGKMQWVSNEWISYLFYRSHNEGEARHAETYDNIYNSSLNICFPTSRI